MAKLEGLEPELDSNNRLVPLTAYGVKAMSMGFLVPQDSPVAWRGLMVQKAMNQLMFEVAWPKLDLLVLDLPPGTGDVQLTITQSLTLNGWSNVACVQDVRRVTDIAVLQVQSWSQPLKTSLSETPSAASTSSKRSTSRSSAWCRT